MLNKRFLGRFCSNALGSLLGVFTFLAADGTADAKRAEIVIEASTGRILHAFRPDHRYYPASLTKLMTLYLLFEALQDGRVTLDTRFSVSRRAALQQPTRLGLRKGDTLRVGDAMLGLITKSANDAAVVIAEGLAGSEIKFAALMTKKVRALGMNATTFRNASGLPNRGQLSTVRDMARLARALTRDFPGYYRYFSTQTFRYANRTYTNSNKLLASYPGTDGLKTGYIRASGFNLVASSKRNGRRLIGVVFGAGSPKQRDRRMIGLLNRGFSVASHPVPPLPEPKPLLGGWEYAWALQVGAFRTSDTAHTALANARRHIPSGVRKLVPIVARVRSDSGRILYRARFIGMDERQARDACRVMSRERIGCQVVKHRAEDIVLNVVGF